MSLIPSYPEVDIEIFPDPIECGEFKGIVCAGGNLSSNTIITAYKQGVFPWYDEGGPILWWSPLARCVIFTKEVHISKNMKKLIKQDLYQIEFDQSFDEIIHLCAARYRLEDKTWISEEIKRAYQRLFVEKIAHCVVVKNKSGQIVGGLYGVFVKNIFCGESMISLEKNTSKLALINLCRYLEENNCFTVDCQLPTNHLLSMGAKLISRERFIKKLDVQENKNLYAKRWGK